MGIVLSCVALLDEVRPQFTSACRTENFPQPFDHLNNEDSAWLIVIADSIDRDTLYLGGSMGSAGSEQPLIGKYEADKLRFAW
jgi:hypothetical protein